MRSVLVLGGTAEARELAAALDGEPQTRVISTARRPRRQAAAARRRGADRRLRRTGWPRDVPARAGDRGGHRRHPSVRRADLRVGARRACARAGVALLRARAPSRSRRPPATTGARVADLDEAARLIPATGRRVFLTTGRQGLAAFARRRRRLLPGALRRSAAAAAAAQPRAAARPRARSRSNGSWR